MSCCARLAAGGDHRPLIIDLTCEVGFFFFRLGWLRENFENQREITTLTVIWARASAACQPSAEAGAGPVGVAERARADEFDAVGKSHT